MLPDVPTVGTSCRASTPANGSASSRRRTSRPTLVERLNREINNGLADPGIKTKIANLGGTAISGTPAAFGKFTAAEVAKWAKVIKFANIKVE